MTETTNADPDALEKLVRTLELGWRLDLPPGGMRRVLYLQRRLETGDLAALAKFGDGSVRLTLTKLISLATHSADKARAFIEQLFGDGTPEMLVMVWRVLNGADVGTLHLDLDQASRFHLEITLRTDRKGTAETYQSDDISDLALIRQFGVAKLNGKFPVLIGFYPTWRPVK